MRSRAKYEFTPNTRRITILENYSFTIEDVRLIINETQKLIYTSSMQKDLITVNEVEKSIDFSEKFPTLNDGDKLTIEIDHLENSEGAIIEMNMGKKLISSAISLRGINSTENDTYEALKNKILSITADININPIENSNPLWHDLIYEVSRWNDVTLPYAFAILLAPGFNQFFLTGAEKYKTSDGKIYQDSQTVSIGDNEVGRENKKTKFIIYRTSTPFFSVNFNTYPNIPMRNKILGAFNLGNDISGISMEKIGLGFFINDSSLKNPVLSNTNRKSLQLTVRQFEASGLNKFIFPPFRADALIAEKSLNIKESSFRNANIVDIQFPEGLNELIIEKDAFSNTKIQSLFFPESLKKLNVNFGAFASSTISSIIIPDYIEELIIEKTIYAFQGSKIKYLYIPNPSKSFIEKGSNGSYNTTNIELFELAPDFSYSVSFNMPPSTYNIDNLIEFVFNRLIDLRSTMSEDVYIEVDSIDNSIVNAVKSDGTPLSGNAKFKKIFRVNQNIPIVIDNIIHNNIISEIIDDNRIKFSAPVFKNGIYPLNYNKILTIGADTIARLSEEQIAIVTDKKWQLK